MTGNTKANMPGLINKKYEFGNGCEIYAYTENDEDFNVLIEGNDWNYAS